MCVVAPLAASVGVPVKTHLDLLKTERPNIIVGTPGRVKDLMTRPEALDLSHVKFFILDECDKMLEGLGMQSLSLSLSHSCRCPAANAS